MYGHVCLRTNSEYFLQAQASEHQQHKHPCDSSVTIDSQHYQTKCKLYFFLKQGLSKNNFAILTPYFLAFCIISKNIEFPWKCPGGGWDGRGGGGGERNGEGEC